MGSYLIHKKALIRLRNQKRYETKNQSPLANGDMNIDMQDCLHFEVDGLVYGINLHSFRGLGFLVS